MGSVLDPRVLGPVLDPRDCPGGPFSENSENGPLTPSRGSKIAMGHDEIHDKIIVAVSGIDLIFDKRLIDIYYMLSPIEPHAFYFTKG